MKFSRRHLLAGSLALAGVMGILPELASHRAYAAPVNGAPIGQTIWLQTTNNHNYVSARTDQTNTPLNASATAIQQWEQFRWAVVNGAATPNFGSNVYVFN
ncbi:MAG TPA: hypothetical protein VGM01_15295, partial [Ktedonobacteraceae bacterium]